MPYNGVNAAVLLLNFIGEAYNDQLSKDLYFLLKDWMGKPVGIEKDGLYMSFLTMNTGIVNMENNETDILMIFVIQMIQMPMKSCQNLMQLVQT